MNEMTKTEPAAFPCCPPTSADDACDVLDFHYRLMYPTTVGAGNRRVTIPVEVKLHFRLTRCRGPLAIGDLVYTTTLLPGEKVRLFTSDRRTRFTYDSSTQLAYRNTQSSEESLFMQTMSDAVFDTNSRDTAHSSNQSHSHVDGHADAGVDILGLGGSANMSGNFDANSVSDFLGEHRAHAESSFHSAEQATRKASSVSVGEVQTRAHTETSSEDHYESASREFSNVNQCHALTFLFYQINKTQTIKYTLEAVERRVVLDPQFDFTKVEATPLAPSSSVGVTSVNVLATASVAKGAVAESALPSESARFVRFPSDVGQAAPAVNIRRQALDQVDKELINAGLLGEDRQVSPEAKQSYSFEKKSSIPTPGLLIKSCLDDCEACEPTVEKEIELDLERKSLENQLLKRQIELLDKAQEYRCCPSEAEAAA